MFKIENSLSSLFLKDLKSFASAVSFLKLFHKLTMRREKEKSLVLLCNYDTFSTLKEHAEFFRLIMFL